MRVRIFAYLSLIAIAITGVVLVSDLLTVSDEEAVDCLLDAVTQHPSSALDDWSDPTIEPVSVQRAGRTERVRSRDALGRSLDDFVGDDVEVVQRSVRVDGDRASATVRARVDGALRDARFRLVRDPERGWRVTSIVAS